MAVLQVTNLSKTIKGKKIINNLTFSINPGDVFGFIGRNGSGKTTTIRMIVGLIKPTTGNVKIKGYDIQNEFTKAMKYASGIVEVPTFYGALTGWENLRQKARLFDEVINDEAILEIVKLIGLEKSIRQKAATYSLGMKQRLAIGLALIGDPDLIIMDEPINGLDLQGVIEIRELIYFLANEKKKAILISSHILSELEQIITKGIIIEKGEKVLDLTTYLSGDKTGDIHIQLDYQTHNSYKKIIDIFAALDIEIKTTGESSIEFHLEKESQLQNILREFIFHNITISQVIKKRKNLEALYLESTEGGKISGVI